MWQPNVLLFSEIVLPAKYEFLKKNRQSRVLNAVLIYTVIISLSLAIIIALFTEALRRRAASTEKDVA